MNKKNSKEWQQGPIKDDVLKPITVLYSSINYHFLKKRKTVIYGYRKYTQEIRYLIAYLTFSLYFKEMKQI